jgi:lipoprotein-releasing system ATP-binding protein
VSELLRELHAQEKTILVVVTHNLELARVFGRQVEMSDGMLQELDSRHVENVPPPL